MSKFLRESNWPALWRNSYFRSRLASIICPPWPSTFWCRAAMAAFFLSSSVSLMILSPPLIVRSFRIRKFSSNRLRRSRSFSRPSIRSLVSAFLLVFLYKSNLNDSKLNTVLKLQLNDLKSRENELWRELFNLPVFSSANTAFSVA